MAEREYVPVMYDWGYAFCELSDAEFGSLIRHLIVYSTTGIRPTLEDRTLRIAFNAMAMKEDAFASFFNAKAKRIREASEKGVAARKKVTDGQPMVTDGNHGLPMVTDGNQYIHTDNSYIHTDNPYIHTEEERKKKEETSFFPPSDSEYRDEFQKRLSGCYSPTGNKRLDEATRRILEGDST